MKCYTRTLLNPHKIGENCIGKYFQFLCLKSSVWAAVLAKAMIRQNQLYKAWTDTGHVRVYSVHRYMQYCIYFSFIIVSIVRTVYACDTDKYYDSWQLTDPPPLVRGVHVDETTLPSLLDQNGHEPPTGFDTKTQWLTGQDSCLMTQRVKLHCIW